jgi:hypothetical protein
LNGVYNESIIYFKKLIITMVQVVTKLGAAALPPSSIITNIVAYYNYVVVTIQNNNTIDAVSKFILCKDATMAQYPSWPGQPLAPILALAKGTKGTIKIQGQAPGTTISCFLAKLDATTGKPVPQIPIPSINKVDAFWRTVTLPPFSINVTDQTKSSISLNFNQGLVDPLLPPVFMLLYSPQNEFAANVFTNNKVIDFLPTDVSPSGVFSTTLSLLQPNVPYWVGVYAKYVADSTSNYLPMKFGPPRFDLLKKIVIAGLIEETLGAPLLIVPTGASFVNIRYFGNATITYRLILVDNKKTPTVIQSSGVELKTSYGTVLLNRVKTPNGNGMYTHSNLVSATTYKYVLQSYESDGITVYDQASYTVTTLGTDLSLQVQDFSIIASWPMAYENASYQLRYKVTGANASTAMKTPVITGTTYTITELLANTSYDVDLYLVEPGTATDTNLPLGESRACTFDDNAILYTLVAAGGILVAAGIGYMYHDTYFKK